MVDSTDERNMMNIMTSPEDSQWPSAAKNSYLLATVMVIVQAAEDFHAK
jgi:hypothetical protein